MAKYKIVLIILVCIIVSLIFRVILPFNNTFTPDGVLFNTVDAYYVIRYAESSNITYDYFIDYPAGAGTNWLFFAKMIAFFAKLFHIEVAIVGAIIPPILFVLILIMVYFIARTLFNRTMALWSVIVLSLLPGNILNRTMLGSADYHCWETFLLTAIFLFSFLSLKNYKRWKVYPYAFAGLVFLSLYWVSWAGALLVPFILIIALVIQYIRTRKDPLMFIAVGLMSGAVLVVLAFVFAPDMSKYAISIMKAMFIPNLSTTILEEYPLLFSNGQFTLSAMWSFFGLIFYIALIGIGALIYRYVKYRDTADLVFIIWTIVTFLMMFAQRRFNYYFAVNAAVVTSYIMVRVYEAVRKLNRPRILVMGFLIVLLMGFSIVKADFQYATSKQGYIDRAWIETTDYLRQFGDDEAYYSGSKSEYGVFAWWSFGYYIVYRSHLPTFRTPGTYADGISTAIFLATNYNEAIKALKEYGMKYVIIDRNMVEIGHQTVVDTGKLFGIIEHEGVPFMEQLYYSGCDGMKLVFTSSDDKVKVFEVQ